MLKGMIKMTMTKIELNNKVVELERIGKEPDVLAHGKRYRTADVNLVDNGERVNNLCVNIEEEKDGDFLDFTKTRYKQFGKVRIA